LTEIVEQLHISADLLNPNLTIWNVDGETAEILLGSGFFENAHSPNAQDISRVENIYRNFPLTELAQLLKIPPYTKLS
jgi:hypothetical protein